MYKAINIYKINNFVQGKMNHADNSLHTTILFKHSKQESIYIVSHSLSGKIHKKLLKRLQSQT